MSIDAEERFREVFRHLGAVTAYARRRGSRDPEALAAEVMTVAWRRLDRLPRDDPRPWLYATARNLLLAERRSHRPAGDRASERGVVDPEPPLLDARLRTALRALSEADREALLLVAWEDLTPAQAARALSMNATAFRVRLLRARRRLQSLLADDARPLPRLDVEEA
jgi:RNA polymerase sigma-70 factor (ECF subfamily)